ncbi:hypothetical protein HYY75_03430, partial [bacterium]|nr:hypothetical protein [bacterium]
MSLRVNQNAIALQSYQSLAGNSERLAGSIEKLSTGLRINRAADDAAGLTISERLRQQVMGLSRAISNAQDGISLIQTAEGALSESHSILQRMRELAVQSANGTLTSDDRLEIQKEINLLKDDLNRISNSTEFNTKKLLDGSLTATISTSSSTSKGIVRGNTSARGDFRFQISQVNQGVAQEQGSNIFTLQNSSTVADSNTKLEDIGQFYDANGAFALANSQTLNIQGNGKSTSIQVSGDLTLGELASRMQTAISGNLGINNVQVFVNPSSSSNPGVIKLQSGLAGQTGEVAFSADQALINALGMSETVASDDPVNTVTRTSLDGSNAISTRTNSNQATGLIEGIDVQFEPVTQAKATGSLQASAGVVITAATTIQITDYKGTAATAAFTAGSYSLDQIASIVNSATGTATTRVSATVVNGQLQLTSADFGTAAYIRVSAAVGAVANMHVGLAEGTYTGSGGTIPQVAGTAAVADLSFAGGNDIVIGLKDSH